MSIIDLFRPKWNHSDWQIGVARVKKITNQALLSKIAMKARYLGVRLAASDKLTDHSLAQIAYVDIAKRFRKSEQVISLLNKITDQSLFFEIANTAWDIEIRKAAVNKINDQDLLVKLAKESRDIGVGMAATEKLTDRTVAQSIYIEFKNSNNRYTRKYFVELLTDHTLLKEIARTDSDSTVREVALKKVIQSKNQDYTQLGDFFSRVPQYFSAEGRDYSILRNKLSEQRLEEANSLTLNYIRYMIHHGYKKYGEFWLMDDWASINSNDLLKIPFIDFLTIDRLWTQYTKDRFGFSVQLRLFEETNEDFGEFCRRVDWNSSPQYSMSASFGHLPNGLFYYRGGFILEEEKRVRSTRTERRLTNPTREVPEVIEKLKDPDWYENRLAIGSPITTDGWIYDPIRKDWYRTVTKELSIKPKVQDSSHGFLAIVTLMKNIGISVKKEN